MNHALCSALMSWLALLPLLVPVNAFADELRLNGDRLFEDATSQGLRLVQDGIELDAGVLVEDDGPAAGFSYQANEEKLSPTVWIRKELIVPDPRARKATLLVAPGGKHHFQVNGKAIDLALIGKAGNYWEAYALPVEALRPGLNEIVLYGAGRVWIARAEDFAAGSTSRSVHPNRSARSQDAGKTWDRDKLGPAGLIDGEYGVRLSLDQHSATGQLTTAVLDAANLAGDAIANPLADLDQIRFAVVADTPAGTRVVARARSGPSINPDTAWSDWRELPASGVLVKPLGRFVQVAFDLSTADPRVTPRLKGLRVQSAPRRSADWTKHLKVIAANNEKVVRSSIPFQYEPYGHPKLKQLRERYRLDDVVQGAKDDLEVMSKLAAWSARQWDQGHLKEAYPAWDALTILQPHADGKPVGGFCQQYNLVLLQACASFGLPGRAVSIGTGDHYRIAGGGHEVVEIWSNQHKKWIYIDGNTAWYLADSESGVPLSLFELRQRQLATVKGDTTKPVRVVALAQTKHQWKGLDGWPALLEMRLIPRSNFLEAKAPLPLNQGMRGWFWTGHQVWTDFDSPASLLYSQRISRPGDWNWTLNQAQVVIEATTKAGELRVHLDTVTPGFAGFQAALDGQPAQAVTSGFTWKLHPGRNQLLVRPRNQAGRDGIASTMTIDFRER